VELLLDTHAAVWWAVGGGSNREDSLSATATEAIASPSNVVWFSAASAWELAIKVRTGRIRIDVEKLVDQLTKNGVRILGIGIDNAITAGSLDWDHSDPFDRMIVAQATRLSLTLVTRDKPIQQFMPAHLPA
jgi:PIN domain nuclease of toxin-antitoxin system